MKLFKILILLFFMCIGNQLMASDPGSNYGCLLWNVKFYTHYWKDAASAPNNPGWTGSFHYYDSGGDTFKVDYNTGGCGNINPSNPMQYTSQSTTCFIYDNGTYYQGELGVYNSTQVTACSLDDYLAILLVFAGFTAYFRLHNVQGD